MKETAPTRSEVEQAVHTLERFGRLGTQPGQSATHQQAAPPTAGKEREEA